MTLVLITGVSGCGKTTVAEDLMDRDHLVIDADADHELSGWFVIGGPDVIVPKPPRLNDAFTRTHEWRWSMHRLQQLNDVYAHELVFVVGTAANVIECLPWFGQSFVLTLSDEVLRHHLIERAKAKGAYAYGFTAMQRMNIISGKDNIQEQLIRADVKPLDANRPAYEISEEIMSIVQP